MRFGDRDTSNNVESQRGMSFGGGGFGGGGGGMGMLLGLVASRFGIVGVLVVVGLMFLFGGNPLSMIGGGGTAVSPQQSTQQSADQICSSDAATHFSCQVLASTEQQWGKIFAARGQQYVPATLVVYDRNGQSGCGAAQSAMGPFYCPTDQRVYLDTEFFNELSQKYGSPGDFAQAYVIAHEIGHHVQKLTGIADKVEAAQARASKAEANALQVKMELQADCYAGVWAASERAALEPGDVEEGMRAASAIGDDTLQKAAQGYAVPESFTHGTSAQRQHWLQQGLQSGDPASCDTFSGSN